MRCPARDQGTRGHSVPQLPSASNGHITDPAGQPRGVTETPHADLRTFPSSQREELLGGVRMKTGIQTREPQDCEACPQRSAPVPSPDGSSAPTGRSKARKAKRLTSTRDIQPQGAPKLPARSSEVQPGRRARGTVQGGQGWGWGRGPHPILLTGHQCQLTTLDCWLLEAFLAASSFNTCAVPAILWALEKQVGKQTS